MDGAKYSMKEDARITSGAYRKVERKKSQQANYLAAHQGQTVSMVSGVVNYQLEGQSNRPYHSQVGMDEQENGSLSYSASSTGESTDSSFAESLRMNEIYDPANLQLSAAAYEMLFKSKSSHGSLPSGRSFHRDSSFASDSLGYSTDGDSYCGYADYSSVAMSRSGHAVPVPDNNTHDHKAIVTASNVSNNTRAPIRGRTDAISKSTISTSTTDKIHKESSVGSFINRTSSNSSTRTPPNAFPINSRNISSSSPATVVTSDVSLSSSGTPPPSYRKTDRDIRNNSVRTKMREEYEDSRTAGSLSYARWWMCGFTDAFNFNS